MDEDKALADISKKLDGIQRLLAIIVVKDFETEQGKIELLDRIGFKPIEISAFLNKSPDNISVQLNIIRKKKQKTAKTKTPEGIVDRIEKPSE